MKLTHCILTGHQFPESIVFDETTGPIVGYKYPPIGKVAIALPTLIEFMNNRQYHNPILAGICRNAFEYGLEPPMINQEFLSDGIKTIPYPKSTKEKGRHLLKYMYNKGGNDLETFDFYSPSDYPLCFAEDHKEFRKIMDYLEENHWIKVTNKTPMAQGIVRYYKVQLTDYGIEEVERDLPKIPLISLVDQKITTGNSDVDEKINHAKVLFFQEPQTNDRMRSACESLSFVLEPLREDLKKHFKSDDVNDFFNMVNRFDIRHNKNKTREIELPEKLEWIFFSLLNTINTYTKLKNKLE